MPIKSSMPLIRATVVGTGVMDPCSGSKGGEDMGGVVKWEGITVDSKGDFEVVCRLGGIVSDKGLA